MSSLIKMPSLSLWFCLLLLTSCASPQAMSHGPAARGAFAFVGQPIVVSGVTSEGQQFTTGEWQGKVILIDFWATWCVPCRVELPHIKSAYAKFHSKGFEVVGISNDFSAAALKKFIATEGDMPWPQLFDPKAGEDQELHPAATKLGIDALPTALLIDRQGILRFVDPYEKLDEQISMLLAK